MKVLYTETTGNLARMIDLKGVVRSGYICSVLKNEQEVRIWKHNTLKNCGCEGKKN